MRWSRRHENILPRPVVDVDTMITVDVEDRGSGYWCRCRLDGEGDESSYVPKKVLLTYKAITAGQVFIWLNIYIDKFATSGAHNKSTEAVYASIANVDSKFAGSQEFIWTLMLLQPGCDLFEALAPVRRDLVALQERGLLCYDSVKHVNARIQVRPRRGASLCVCVKEREREKER